MSLPQMRGRLLEAELILEEDARTAARLDGFRLVFDRAVPQHERIGHANLREDSGSTVEGVLYNLPVQALAVLDRYEKVAERQGRRIEVEVLSGGVSSKAFAYVAGEDWVRDGLVPSRNHLYRLLSAQKFLSPEYFAALKACESIKVAVDDEGMPHGVKKKVQRQVEEVHRADRPVTPTPTRAPVRNVGKKAAVELDKNDKADKDEKKKFYPAVGAYAPKSARAFRKAFGIPEKKDNTGAGEDAQDRGASKPSPWAGRSTGDKRDSKVRKDGGTQGNANPWAGRGKKKPW